MYRLQHSKFWGIDIFFFKKIQISRILKIINRSVVVDDVYIRIHSVLIRFSSIQMTK